MDTDIRSSITKIIDMERIKLTNKTSENAEKELPISDVLRGFYDYHWKRTDIVEKFYDYHWKNPIKIAQNTKLCA